MKRILQATGFYLSLPFLYFISLLPFRLLYLLSDGLYFILAKILRYRRHVVLSNLKNSFPEKGDNEINKIADEYYVFLCDLIVETFKMLTITPKQLLKRCRFHNPEVFNELYRKQKSVIAVMGHYGNWEWANISMTLSFPYQLNAIYRPLTNPDFNHLLLKIRSRFGARLVTMNQTLRSFIEDKNKLTVTAFLSDQTAGPDHSYWINFLHQETTVFPGPEKIAKKYNYPVVFCSVDRVRRGYYEIHSELLCENPADTMDGKISELHTRRLEQYITKKPYQWLWSHNKWKFKRKK